MRVRVVHWHREVRWMNEFNKHCHRAHPECSNSSMSMATTTMSHCTRVTTCLGLRPNFKEDPRHSRRPWTYHLLRMKHPTLPRVASRPSMLSLPWRRLRTLLARAQCMRTTVRASRLQRPPIKRRMMPCPCGTVIIGRALVLMHGRRRTTLHMSTKDDHRLLPVITSEPCVLTNAHALDRMIQVTTSKSCLTNTYASHERPLYSTVN